MLHRLTFAPFPNVATDTWFAALGDALEADGVTGLLLSNLAVSEALMLPAVAVLPGRVVVLQPAFSMPGGISTQKQQVALADWLGNWPELPPVPATAIVGLTIDSDSAAAAKNAAAWPATTLEALPQLLRELPTMPLLSAAVLGHWVASLVDDEEDADTYSTGFWEQKARQLWNWLGAADVPADPPYGLAPAPPAPPADTAAEQQRLEQLRQQLFAELEQQRQQMESRETAREQNIAQLQQQLAATPSAAAEVAALQARLAAETQEKNTLAAAIAASRQEAEVRSRELEARMLQLGQQVEQLQTRPTPTPPAAPVAATSPATASLPLAQSARMRAGASTAAPRPVAPPWRLQWPRVALVLGLLAFAGAGGWAVQHLARPQSGPAETRRSSSREVQPEANDENLEAAAPTLLDIQPDTIREASEPADSAEERVLEPAAPQPGETMDSVTAPDEGI